MCVDSGCNRVILVSEEGVAHYRRATKSFLRTAQVEGRLKIEGRGKIGTHDVLHVSDASANLMSTRSIVLNQCRVEMGYDAEDNLFWCEIVCYKGQKFGVKDKTTICGGSRNQKCWIFCCAAAIPLKKNIISKTELM